MLRTHVMYRHRSWYIDGPFLLNFRSKFKSFRNTFNAIRMLSITWVKFLQSPQPHNSRALDVLCCNHYIGINLRVKRNFHLIWNWVRTLLLKRALYACLFVLCVKTTLGYIDRTTRVGQILIGWLWITEVTSIVIKWLPEKQSLRLPNVGHVA